MRFSFLFSLVTLLLLQHSCSASVIVVDGVSEWKSPQPQIGDFVIFQHKNGYTLYIFQNQRAFSVCNFTQATILTKNNSTSYTWHVSRPGIFYFSLNNNGSNQECLKGQKLAIKVLPPSSPSPSPSPSPPSSLLPSPRHDSPAPGHSQAPKMPRHLPSPGGIVASSPAFPWPFQPRESDSPSPSPDSYFHASISPSPMTNDREGIPFINSNPAVPLPTGEVDSATIRPLPTSGSQRSRKVLSFLGVQRAFSCVVFLIMMV